MSLSIGSPRRQKGFASFRDLLVDFDVFFFYSVGTIVLIINLNNYCLTARLSMKEKIYLGRLPQTISPFYPLCFLAYSSIN